jgi:hypothetical protein
VSACRAAFACLMSLARLSKLEGVVDGEGNIGGPGGGEAGSGGVLKEMGRLGLGVLSCGKKVITSRISGDKQHLTLCTYSTHSNYSDHLGLPLDTILEYFHAYSAT